MLFRSDAIFIENEFSSKNEAVQDLALYEVNPENQNVISLMKAANNISFNHANDKLDPSESDIPPIASHVDRLYRSTHKSIPRRCFEIYGEAYVIAL